MKTLVLVEHENAAGQGRHAGRGHRRREAGRGPAAGRRRRASARSPRPPRRSPASARSMSPTMRPMRHGLAENVAPLVAGADGRPRRLPRARHHHRQEYRAARRRAARRDADFRHPLGRGRRHLHPPDLCRQRHRHGEVVGRQEGDHRARHRLRQGGGRGRLAARSRPFRRGDAGPVELRRRRDRQARAARADQRQDHRLGRPRAQDRASTSSSIIEPLADKLGAARRRHPRRGRRGLCPQRLSGRPDRQDRRARASISRSASPARSSISPA